ncbi:hypothetical protein P43SY_003327 [Pythium insidiosum]|uniref:Transmembrane protein n=1 Tax=Pythium insidiosum TaxID=114742 RepID=A0AAD5LCP3_PYTIN|nr:hypothetical protein P43SY_003327 [Pythium insidiosum]
MGRATTAPAPAPAPAPASAPRSSPRRATRRLSLLGRRRLTRVPSGIGNAASPVDINAVVTLQTTTHAWVHAGSAVLVVLRNASVCVALTWLVAWAISNGDLVAAARRTVQRDETFLLGTLLTSHVVCCLAITLVQASLLLHTHFLSQQTTRTTLRFSAWRIVRRSVVWFVLSVALLIGGTKGLWWLCAPDDTAREAKLPYYFMWFTIWLYNMAIDLVGRYVYRHETVEGRRSALARHPVKTSAVAPVASPTVVPVERQQRSGLQRTLSALRRVARARSPMYIVIIVASTGIHALSHWVIRNQIEMMALMIGSIVVKLIVQGLTRRTLLRRNVKNIRTMFLTAAPTTVLLETQVRLMLQRAKNTQLTVAGTVIMAIVEIALRLFKSAILRRQLAQWERQRSRRTLDVACSRIASGNDGDDRYGAKLLAYRSAELYADMSAEYIAMGCSSAILYFCWDHPHYRLSAGLTPSNTKRLTTTSAATTDTWTATRTWILLAQVMGEVVVDMLSCVFEVANGLRFDGVQQQRAYLAFLFVVAAVGNVAISSGVYLYVHPRATDGLD